MKKILVSLLVISLALVSCNNTDKTKYSGTVVDKFYEGPTSGYKSSSEPNYVLMVFETRAKKIIRVETSVPTYYSFNRGDSISVELSNIQMYYLGNLTDTDKNLYGE